MPGGPWEELARRLPPRPMRAVIARLVAARRDGATVEIPLLIRVVAGQVESVDVTERYTWADDD